MKLISNRIEPKSPLYTEMIVNGCKFEEHFVTNYQQSIHTSKQHIINQFGNRIKKRSSDLSFICSPIGSFCFQEFYKFVPFVVDEI